MIRDPASRNVTRVAAAIGYFGGLALAATAPSPEILAGAIVLGFVSTLLGIWAF